MNTILNPVLFTNLLAEAEDSTRKRSHHNLHDQLSDPVQRVCIALQQRTYVRPHKHSQNNKWELMLSLQGTVGLLIFNNDGTVLDRLELTPNSEICGIEIKPNTWHTVFPVTKTALIIEIKEGPYIATKPSDFAAWSPEEGSNHTSDFLQWAKTANCGESYNK